MSLRRRRRQSQDIGSTWFWRPLIGTFLLMFVIAAIGRALLSPNGMEPNLFIWAAAFAVVMTVIDAFRRSRSAAS